MKTLIVQTDGSTDSYEVNDRADLQILDNGSLYFDDYHGTVIVYAVGRFTSAIIEPIPEV